MSQERYFIGSDTLDRLIVTDICTVDPDDIEDVHMALLELRDKQELLRRIHPYCSACGMAFRMDEVQDHKIPTHSHPVPTRRVCPGSGKAFTNLVYDQPGLESVGVTE